VYGLIVAAAAATAFLATEHVHAASHVNFLLFLLLSWRLFGSSTTATTAATSAAATAASAAAAATVAPRTVSKLNGHFATRERHFTEGCLNCLPVAERFA
jgi:hypothetical protein